ncbi:MAG TPA: ABC transporter permease [Pyrinomonadaceae bacterium]|nr:ABC transporter permease [Pyrinomonadaceae bacterium]
MRKFFAVVKHEYKRVVLKWSFLIATLLLPFLAACFAVVPALIFSIQGEPTRIAIVDPTGGISARLKGNLSAEKMAERAEKAAADPFKNINASQEERMKQNAGQFVENFVFVDYPYDRNNTAGLRQDLTNKILNGEIDAYLIIPPDISSPDTTFEFRSRRASDILTNETFKDALNGAVRSQRLADANISEEKVNELSSDVNIDVKGVNELGQEKDTEGVMVASFVIGLMIYITLAIYGQAIMGAVVEEKETRIAEILFSSARPFELMLGKLVGVGLAGLTQLAIWIATAAVLVGVVAAQFGGTELLASVPTITPLMVLYFLTFFLLGFFLYASIFALIGSMVTTVQEGGQFAFPPIMILLIGFYFSFAVVRDPNSTLSFWVSIAPFFAPITMPVRILAETPPFWQIALAIAINAAAIVVLVWLASRVYRVGMLMYGKRATLSEVWKWIRQS